MEKEFETTCIIVKKLLTKYPKTRNSDDLLYIKVIETLNKGASGKPFKEVMLNIKELGFPCYETVRRTRQKLQEQNPDLKAIDVVQDFRTKREEDFRKEFGKK